MDSDELAAAFDAERRHLQRVGYGILGSLSEAEDVVQEAWLRLDRLVQGPHSPPIRDLRGWLTTTVTRLALDVLASARSRRERYVGPWLPEPLVSAAESGPTAGAVGEDPGARVAREEEISLALLIVLERLSPAERAAFVLHDVFGYDFAEAGRVLDRTPAATRQLAARARSHVASGRPRFPPSRDEQRQIVEAFVQACGEGSVEGLVSLLDPEVVWRTDGGGVVSAAQRVHHGAEKVARAMVALGRRPPEAIAVTDINGFPGVVMRDASGALNVVSLTVDAGRIVAVDIMRNPEKLGRVPEPGSLPG